MMTLLPMAAFASADVYSRAATYTYLDDEVVDADDNDEATITVVFRDGSGRVLPTGTDVTFWLESSRDAENITLSNGTMVAASDGSDIYEVNAKVEAGGIIEIEVTSGISGEATISLYQAYSLVDDEGKNLIDSEKITFEAGATKVNQITLINKDASIVEVGKEIELEARVVDATYNGMSNEKVTFKAKKADSTTWSTIGIKDTDRLGRAAVKVSYTSAGEYEFRAEVGRVKSATEVAEWTTLGAMSIEFTETDKKFDIDSDIEIDLKLYDYYGNEIDFTKSLIEVEYVSVPSDSKKKDEVRYDIHDTKSQIIIPAGELDKDGEYTIKAKVKDTGVQDRFTFLAKEFGDVTELEGKNGYVRIGAKTVLEVKEVDKEGIKRNAKAGDYVVYSSNPANIVVAVSGDDFEIRPTNKDAEGSSTITIKHRDENIVGTLTAYVVGEPAALNAKVDVKGLTADVTVQLVDKNGNNTWEVTEGDNPEAKTVEYEVFAGALRTSDVKDITKKGKGEFKLVADKAGKYSVTVVTENGVAKTFDVTFGEDVQPDGKVTLFIGQQVAVVNGDATVLDVAPFIKDNRTFVPVRFVAEALGAEVKWDEATQTVTATRGDDVVVLTIGSNVMTVNGDAAVTDVAPFIAEGNRTVLPFRAVAEAFGAEVKAEFNEDGTTHSVVFEI